MLAAILVSLDTQTKAQEEGAGQIVMDAVREAQQEVEGVTVEELAGLMASEQKVTVLDVRTEAEYVAGHLRGSIWIPRGKLEFAVLKGKLEVSSDPIVAYCRIHGRSALAAAALKRLGFAQPLYLVGGFQAWAKGSQTIFNKHGELIVKEFEKDEAS
jgi:rhodanese-related sulfurtransferase